MTDAVFVTSLIWQQQQFRFGLRASQQPEPEQFTMHSSNALVGGLLNVTWSSQKKL